jgi:hypothetical protein
LLWWVFTADKELMKEISEMPMDPTPQNDTDKTKA